MTTPKPDTDSLARLKADLLKFVEHLNKLGEQARVDAKALQGRRDRGEVTSVTFVIDMSEIKGRIDTIGDITTSFAKAIRSELK